jgi:hypothetical protein
MRKAIVLTLAAFAACGPSSTQVKAAKEAHYTGDKAAIFAGMKEAVEGAHYKIHEVDESTLTLKTEMKWFNPDGTGAMVAEGDVSHLPDRSVSVVHVIQVLPDGDKWIVADHLLLQRHFAGRPNNDVLQENDPSVPGYAHDQVDTLASAIHDGLKQYEVQTVPAQPAGGGAPPPAMGGGGY